MPRSQQRAERLHLFISGFVQGVCFRFYTRDKAMELGLVGWVRNLHDGRVEVVAEGPSDKLEKLEEWCRQGPPAARVTDVQATRESATGEFEGFCTG